MRLVVNDLACHRGDDPIFSKISFVLEQGQGLAVTGPNGAGKSTLLRCLAGLLRQSGGTIDIEASDASPDGFHFITALNGLKPALTVRENLDFWQAYAGAPWMKPVEALAQFELSHVIDVPFGELSTGQKRRVSLARLFLNAFDLWLLDEPTSGLDAASEKRFAQILKRHLADGGLFVAATHLPLGVEGVRTLRFEGGAP